MSVRIRYTRDVVAMIDCKSDGGDGKVFRSTEQGKLRVELFGTKRAGENNSSRSRAVFMRGPAGLGVSMQPLQVSARVNGLKTVHAEP